MARSTGFTFLWALLLGIVAASLFFLYGPYFNQEIDRRVKAALEKHDFTLRVAKGSDTELKGAPGRATGTRYQLVSEGGKTFLADLQTGRVWRYFHYGKAEGWSREEEGFAPLRFYFGNKKYLSAAEVPAVPEGGDTRVP